MVSTLNDPLKPFARVRTADVNALIRANSWVCLCLGLLFLTSPLLAVTVDDFSADQGALTLTDPASSPGDTAFSFVNDGSILGSERTLRLTLISVAATESTSAEVTGGELVFSADAGTRGQVEAGYDGTTGDPDSPLDVTVGLGGVDLTNGGADSGFRLVVSSTSAAGVEIEVDVHSSATEASRFGLRLPAIGASQNFICSFADFGDLGSAGGADFSAVTAIVLRVRGTGVTANISALETVGPELLQANVVNIDTLADGDADGFADPGETIKFSITLTNTGAEAQDISLGDVLDQNVTGQAMSLFTTPIAQRDTYQTCGNVSLTIDAATGVLANDSDPDGDSTLPNAADPILTVSATDTTLTQGTVNLNADGSFTYEPPAAFQGVDTFGYTVTDDDGRTTTGEVAVMMSSVVWFLDDDDDTGPFTGTLANPFNSLSAAAAASRPGDILYVFSDDGVIDRLNETIALKDDQQLIGGGVPFDLCGLDIAAGTTPGLSDTGFVGGRPAPPPVAGRGADKGIVTPPTVDAGNRNQIRGLRLEAGDRSPLEASSVADLTVADTSLVRTSSFVEGLTLSSVSGTVSVTRLSIQDTGSMSSAINILNSSADVDVVDSTITPTGGGLFYSMDDGSTVDFTGGSMMLTGGNGVPAIELDTNTGAYTFGSLTSVNTSNPGILATGGGTFNVPAATTVTSTASAALDVTGNTAFGVDPLTFASLSASGTALGIRLEDVVQGLTVTGPVTVTSTDRGLVASNMGTVTMNNAANAVVSTGGVALDLQDLAAAMTFARVSSSGSGTVGVDFQNVTGGVTINDAAPGSSISGATGAAFRVGALGTNLSGGTANISFAGDITNTAGPSIEITERNGGTVTLSGAINDSGTGAAFRNNANGTATSIVLSGGSKVFNTGTSNALFLDDNDNALFTFSGGGLDVDTTTGSGFVATGGAAGINVTGSNNSVTTAGGPAISISNSTIGTSGITFRSVAVNGMNGTVTAIRLASTGAGTFSVLGDGTTTVGGNGSGGTIEDILDADAIILDNTDGLVTLQNLIVEDIDDSGDGGDAIGTRSLRDGIHGQNVDGGLLLQSVTMRRFSDHAILGAQLSDGVSFTNWNGLTLNDSIFENTNRFHVANRGDDGDEGMIRMRGLTGTMRVDNCTFRLGARGLDIFTPTATGTLDATIQRSSFLDLYKEFATGATPNVGARGVSFQAEGSHDMVVRIGDPAQSNAALGNLFINNLTASVVINGQGGGGTPHTGDIDTVISRNTFRITDHTTPQVPPGNLSFNFPQGGVALVPAGGTFDAIVSHNLFDEVMHAAGGLGQLTLGLNGGAVQAHVHDNEFRLPWDGPVQIRVEDVTSAAVLFEDNTYTDGMVGSAADDVGFPTQSPFNPFLVNVLAGGNLDLTLRREVLAQHDTVFTPADRRHAIEVETQADNGGNTIDLHIVDSKGPAGYHLKRFNGTFNLFQGASASSVPATIIGDNGNTGGGNDDNTVPPLVVVDGTVNAVGSAPTLPSITIP